MRLNINRVLLVIFVMLFGIGGFYTIGQSQDKSTTEPRVTIIGDPGKLPLQIQRDLPTGYSWQSEDAVTLPNSSATDKNDPTIVFLIDPHNPNINMKEQMEYARSMGKEEVFFLTLKEIDPNLEPVPFGMEDLVKTIAGLDLYSIDFRDIVFDFVNTPAYATSVQGSNCGGPTVPAGTCSSHSLTDDDLSDGKTPGFKLCVDYAAFSCYFNSIFDHLKKNVAISSTQSCNHTSSNSSPCPWVDCMKAENGSSTIKAPVNLTVQLYRVANDLKTRFNPPGLACNIPNLCGCAFPTTQSGSTRTSIDGRMAMNGQHSCSWLELMRHELAHTYDFSHGDFSNNLENSKHCKNKHQVH